MSYLLKINNFLNYWFELTARKSSLRQEIIAGTTTFLSMIYSVIVIPNMLSQAGFPQTTVFIATCLVASFGSIIMGIWVNLPIAVGCAVSLTAFTAFNLILGKNITIPVALGAIFLMGILFTMISITGIRKWILSNLPIGIANGTGIGIGLFLLLIASDSIGLIVKNVKPGLPIVLGNFTSFPILLSIIGLSVIFGLEKLRVPGSLLLTIIIISIIGLIIDPNVKYKGFFSIPTLNDIHGNTLIFKFDILGALNPIIFSAVFALIITAIFDATGTIRAIADQANLLDNEKNIIKATKALAVDSMTSIFSAIVGSSPAAVYIESAAGTAAGGKTGLTAITVGVLFIFILFMSPLIYLVPSYATAPSLMYVGLLMLSNVSKINFDDFIDAMSGLLTAVFIVLTCNIVTGIMLGFNSLVIGRIVSGEFYKINLGTLTIAIILVIFYIGGWAL